MNQRRIWLLHHINNIYRLHSKKVIVFRSCPLRDANIAVMSPYMLIFILLLRQDQHGPAQKGDVSPLTQRQHVPSVHQKQGADNRALLNGAEVTITGAFRYTSYGYRQHLPGY